LEALKLFDRDWKQIEKFIGTKTVIQIRSHAQKYFLKVQKNPTSAQEAHIPPPRAKRKSTPAQNQSQKKTKEGVHIPWIVNSESVNGNVNLSNPILNNSATFAHWMASNGLLPPVNTTTTVPQVVELQKQQQEQLAKAQSYFQQVIGTALQKEKSVGSEIPNFSKIFSFLGSLFNNEMTQENHLQEFRDLTTLDQTTIQLLMHNLTINIANEQFKNQHLHLIDQYKKMMEENGKESPQSNVKKTLENPKLSEKERENTPEVSTA